MHTSNTKIPAFPRNINRYSYVRKKVDRHDKKPVLVKNIKQVRVNQGSNNNNKTVFPELFHKKWFPFVLDGKQLISIVPSMIGSLTDKRVASLKSDWAKWLKEWIKVNRLDVLFDDGTKKPKAPAAKQKKQGKQKEPQEKPLEEMVELEEEQDETVKREKENPLLWPTDG